MLRLARRAVVVAALLLTGLAAATGTAPYPALPADGTDLTTGLNRLLADYLAWRPLVAGAAVSVTAPGRHAVAAAGRRRLFGSPLSAGDGFRIASVTKTFTAAAVLRLAETGRLRLDDSAAEHLPADLAAAVPRASVRQLLNHTAGLADYGTDPGWLVQVAASPGRVWRPRELLAQAFTRPAPPTGRFHYADTGYLLLGGILEHVTAQPLPIAYRQLLPMQLLPHTWLEGRETPPPGQRLRVAEYAGPLDLTGHDPSFDNLGGGGLVSTVGDLDRFTAALFSGHVFDHDTTLQQMLTVTAAEPGSGYGLGIGRRTLAGETVWLHPGFSGTILAWIPHLHASIGATTGQVLARPDRLLTAVIRLLRQHPPTPPLPIRQSPNPPEGRFPASQSADPPAQITASSWQSA